MTEQIRWVGVRPDGTVCGPCMETEEDCKEAHVVGYRRTVDRKGAWKDIEALGYTVRRARVILFDENE